MQDVWTAFFDPLHPKLVHFPIALAITAMGMQALGLVFKKEAWRAAAWIMFVLAAVAMPVVALSGWLEADDLRLHHSVLGMHKLFALTATGTVLAALPFLWFLRKRNAPVFPAIFLALTIIVSGLLLTAAHYGGKMVYEYGVGVSR